MKAVLWSALVTAALAAPPFVLQSDAAAASQHRLADLTVDDFHAVQHAFAEAYEGAVDEAKNVVHDTFGLVHAEEDDEPHHPTHPLPPPVLDFRDYTVLEIVNASYHKHHDGGEHEGLRNGGFLRKLRKGLGFTLDGIEPHKPKPEDLPFSHLAWLLNFSPEAAKLLEQDDITLLAPDNHALTPPHKRREHGVHGPPHGPGRDRFAKLSDAVDAAPQFVHPESPFARQLEAAPHPFHSREFSPKKLAKLAENEGDDHDEEKKRLFRMIIAYFGRYHILPGKYHPKELADRSTIATSLNATRVRVEPSIDFFPFPHPTLKFNGYARKVGPTILAKNGVIFGLNEPLVPPLGPLNQLFLTPRFFSGLTNAIQKVDLDDVLLPHRDVDVSDLVDDADVSPMVEGLIQEIAGEHGVKEFTVFAPSNWAFGRLPLGVAAFLHSPLPFAKKVLKYLLAYHVVPDITFYSDFFKNDTAVQQYRVKEEIDVEVPHAWLSPAHEGPHPPPHTPEPPHVPRANVTHYVLPTLLTHFNANATLKIGVVSYRILGKGPIRREILVFPTHGPDHHHEGGDKPTHFFRKLGGGEGDMPKPQIVKVAYPDVPARAGAIHVLGSKFLLPPPPAHKHDGEKDEYDEEELSLLSSQFDFTKKEAKKLRKTLFKLLA
ncbi:fasciclin domain-containing protein [Rhodotorula paludigena]|uniref:fasciclin domain-containing protein n=1 Tax=Rhodotorula paludigena TaxID=86838 RepID=UPI00317D1358